MNWKGCDLMNSQKGLTVVFQPDGRKAVVPRGVTLLEAARKAGVAITTRCGGKAGCLMCKVTMESQEAAFVRPPGDAERRKLGGLLDKGVRLACQTAVWEDVTVIVPEDPLKAAVRRKLEAARRREDDALW
ncbi:2Fe-2S iron-sulfur cluster-binding protein [Paenibacillus sp. BR2-3]|uniref:2Fe-2S iron-sulfur cluster-binding protein n=1 Tax=Paenibacillus sp. BR2-3 TaxID=3048494 RepID=UPI0039779B6E